MSIDDFECEQRIGGSADSLLWLQLNNFQQSEQHIQFLIGKQLNYHLDEGLTSNSSKVYEDSMMSVSEGIAFGVKGDFV